MSRCDSFAIVPKTSDDLPEPLTPVKTVSRRFGISTSTFLRLFSRAPTTRIISCESAMCGGRLMASKHGMGVLSIGRPSIVPTTEDSRASSILLGSAAQRSARLVRARARSRVCAGSGTRDPASRNRPEPPADGLRARRTRSPAGPGAVLVRAGAASCGSSGARTRWPTDPRDARLTPPRPRRTASPRSCRRTAPSGSTSALIARRRSITAGGNAVVIRSGRSERVEAQVHALRRARRPPPTTRRAGRGSRPSRRPRSSPSGASTPSRPRARPTPRRRPSGTGGSTSRRHPASRSPPRANSGVTCSSSADRECGSPLPCCGPRSAFAITRGYVVSVHRLLHERCELGEGLQSLDDRVGIVRVDHRHTAARPAAGPAACRP